MGRWRPEVVAEAPWAGGATAVRVSRGVRTRVPCSRDRLKSMIPNDLPPLYVRFATLQSVGASRFTTILTLTSPNPPAEARGFAPCTPKTDGTRAPLISLKLVPLDSAGDRQRCYSAVR
jgi:hypothetical protein